MSETTGATGVARWVSVVFMQGDDYDTAMDETNANGGSVSAAIEYLAQWDNGTESEHEMSLSDSEPWGPHDTTHTESFNGIEYTYATNHGLSYVSLSRRVLPEIIAEYGDGSGDYRIERTGNTLTAIISEGERLSATLERAPEYDDSDARAEYALTERFSSAPAGDLDPLHDVVWIDYLAYLAVHEWERAYVVSSLTPGGAGRRGYENTAALTMANATELAERLTGLGMAGVTIERTGATDARCSNAPSGEHERAGGVCRFCGK